MAGSSGPAISRVLLRGERGCYLEHLALAPFEC
jgi:hypothetical protein